jgi:hypothetical protein
LIGRLGYRDRADHRAAPVIEIPPILQMPRRSFSAVILRVFEFRVARVAALLFPRFLKGR